MSLEQQLSDAIAAQNNLTQAVAAKKGEIDAATAAQLAAFETWKASILNTSQIGFDPSVVRDKTSLVGSGTANVDPANNTMSKWILISSEQFYVSERQLVLIDAVNNVATAPGAAEATPYTNDKCISNMQYVCANTAATSDQINARLTALGIPLNDYGDWAQRYAKFRTTCIQIPGVHPYSGIWMRFVNRWSAPGSGPAQAINTYGGNSFSKLRMATVYHGMNY